ncbi:MAG: hypothetical protein AB7R89_13700 [Dehalococcoidia bacterium]
MTDDDLSYMDALARKHRSGGKAVATENTTTTTPPTGEGAGMLPFVAQIAEMIRAYYEGLGTMPEPLKETLTREFAGEINRAMGSRIAGKG